LTYWEKEDKALEGKGALVFDYRNQKIYVSLSPRAEIEVINDLISKWNAISLQKYKAVTFISYDKKGEVIYHTDCMMTLLNEHAVISITSIMDKKMRKNVILELSNPP